MRTNLGALVLLTALALSVAAIQVPVQASKGNILIDSKTAPSPPKTVAAGGNTSLYFGLVEFSGGVVRLYYSRDGYSHLGAADKLCGPEFRVSDIRNSTEMSFHGYSIGYDWINGSIPVEIGGGEWFVKAFDGSTASVAVTDRPLIVTCLLDVTPSSGPGQASIELKGYGFTPDSHVNLSYTADGGATWTAIEDFVAINGDGLFTYNMSAPDLGKAITSTTDHDWRNSTVTFRAVSLECESSADFAEFWRGLVQVDGEVAEPGMLYGNETDFTSTVQLKVYGDLILAGKWFHPGEIALLWDGAQQLGTTSANATGFFNTTVAVPVASNGEHNVTIDDGKTTFVIYVNVIPTLILTPDTGPVGTEVTAEGYAFLVTPGPNGENYNVTLTWDYTNYCLQLTSAENMAWAWTDENGSFVTAFIVPHTTGGSHVVTAEDNATAPTVASAVFTVTVDLAVTPGTIANNGTEVTVYGTGLNFLVYHDLNIANIKNEMAIFSNCTGDFVFEFVAGSSFSPGIHVMSLYSREQYGEYLGQPQLEKYVLFNATGPTELSDNLDEYYSLLNASLTELDEMVRKNSEMLDDSLSGVRDYIEASMETAIENLRAAAQNAGSAAEDAKTAAETAQTTADEAKSIAETAQLATGEMMTVLYTALTLSLIAAIAAVASLTLLFKERRRPRVSSG